MGQALGYYKLFWMSPLNPAQVNQEGHERKALLGLSCVPGRGPTRMACPANGPVLANPTRGPYLGPTRDREVARCVFKNPNTLTRCSLKSADTFPKLSLPCD